MPADHRFRLDYDDCIQQFETRDASSTSNSERFDEEDEAVPKTSIRVTDCDSCALPLPTKPETPFHRNWHIELIAAKLDACRRGREPSCDHQCSAAKPEVALCVRGAAGLDPRTQSCGSNFVRKLRTRPVRQARSRLPQRHDEFLVSGDVRYAALGAEAVSPRIHYHHAGLSNGHLGWRGTDRRGADFIIIDDPLKPADAPSEPLRRSANAWFDKYPLQQT